MLQNFDARDTRKTRRVFKCFQSLLGRSWDTEASATHSEAKVLEKL